MTARKAKPEIMPRLLSRDQVAAYLGVSPETVSAWVAEGILPAPIRLHSLVKWDIISLNLAIDRAFGLPTNLVKSDRQVVREEVMHARDETARALRPGKTP